MAWRLPWLLTLLALALLLGAWPGSEPESIAWHIGQLAGRFQGYVFAALAVGLLLDHRRSTGRLATAVVGTLQVLAYVAILWLALLGLAALALETSPWWRDAAMAAAGGAEYRVMLVAPPLLFAVAGVVGLAAVLRQGWGRTPYAGS